MTKKQRPPVTASKSLDKGIQTVIAQSVLRPTVQNATTIRKYSDWLPVNVDLTALVKTLAEQTEAVIGGDLKRGEAMLTAQAHTLDAIFNNLTRRAVNVEHLIQFDTYLKLGLRAQAQCRATWEAISAVKYPPMAGYVRQANIALGPQQVNNETATRARENENSPNKLLEEQGHEPDKWMDNRAPQTTGQIDWIVETVDEIDGSEEQGR